MAIAAEVKQKLINKLIVEWGAYNAYFESTEIDKWDNTVNRNMETVERHLSLLWNMSVGDTQTELYDLYAKATVGC